jgi:hypothetical protein
VTLTVNGADVEAGDRRDATGRRWRMTQPAAACRSAGARAAGQPLAGLPRAEAGPGWSYVKAPMPVMARPTMRVCMVSVPSKV